MFAIVKVGAAQYKVSEGDLIRPNRMKVAKGDKVTLDQVLLLSDGKNVQIGQPFLEGVSIEADVVEHGQGDKVIAFKSRRRKGYMRKVGHRTQQTFLNITRIAAK